MQLHLSHIVDISTYPQLGGSGAAADVVVAENGTDGILVVEGEGSAVAWYDATGLILLQRMTCPARPRKVCFCRFPSSSITRGIGSSADPELAPGASSMVAVVAWVGEGDLQIFHNGNHHDVKFPFVLTGLYNSDFGLILEAQHGILHQTYKRLYSLSRPEGTIRPMSLPNMLRGKPWSVSTVSGSLVGFNIAGVKEVYVFELKGRSENDMNKSFLNTSAANISMSQDKSIGNAVDMSTSQDKDTSHQFIDDDLFAKEPNPKLDDLVLHRGSSTGKYQHSAAAGVGGGGGARRSSIQSSHRYSTIPSQRRGSSSPSAASLGGTSSPQTGRLSGGGGEGGIFSTLLGMDHGSANFNTASLMRQASRGSGAHLDSPLAENNNIQSNIRGDTYPSGDASLGAIGDADASFLGGDFAFNAGAAFQMPPTIDAMNTSADMSVASLRSHADVPYANRPFAEFAAGVAEVDLEYMLTAALDSEVSASASDIILLRSRYLGSTYVTILQRSSGALLRYKCNSPDGSDDGVYERVLSLSNCTSCIPADIRVLPNECILVTRDADCIAVIGSHILDSLDCAPIQLLALRSSHMCPTRGELSVVAEARGTNNEKSCLARFVIYGQKGAFADVLRRFAIATSKELDEPSYVCVAQSLFNQSDDNDIMARILLAFAWSAIAKSLSGLYLNFDQYMHDMCSLLDLNAPSTPILSTIASNVPVESLPKLFDIIFLISEDLRLKDKWTGKQDVLVQLQRLRQTLALIAHIGAGPEKAPLNVFGDIAETSDLVKNIVGPERTTWEAFTFSNVLQGSAVTSSQQWLSHMLSCFTSDALQSKHGFGPYLGVQLEQCGEWLPTITKCYEFMHNLWNHLSQRANYSSERITEGIVRAFMTTKGCHDSTTNLPISDFPPPLALLISVSICSFAENLKPSITASSLPSSDDNAASKYLDSLFLLSRHDIVLNIISSLRAFKSSNLLSEETLDDVPSLNMIRSLCASPIGLWRRVSRITSHMRSKVNDSSNQRLELVAGSGSSSSVSDDAEGLHQLLISTYARFPEDERVREACKILCSTKEMSIRVHRAPDMDDAAFKAKLQQKLLYYCRRAFAASIGRGMATLGSLGSFMTEPLRIPVLAVTGRVPPMNSVLQIDSLTPELIVWPEFHCGVAAGLRIRMASDPSTSHLVRPIDQLPRSASDQQLRELLSVFDEQDSNKGAMRYWILYNRTLQGATPAAENGHAGVLLALGMLGHLRALTIIDICEYLVSGRQTTIIGVLLGLAASHICTSDTVVSKTLYLHIPSLIPTTTQNEVEIPVVVQCAAITGLGLLYCGSGNRSMAEFLLSELHRRPPCEKGTDSGEAFALSAAWALGMVCIGRGGVGKKADFGSPLSPFQSVSLDILDSLHDLKLDERLLRCITGEMGSLGESDFKAKQSGKGIFANSYSGETSSRGLLVLEPEGLVNTVFTSFGAIVALSLIFIKSNNESIASRLRPPSTCFGLESERPDLLCMRTLAVRLINWNDTEAACFPINTAREVANWLETQVPKVLHEWIFDPSPPGTSSSRGTTSDTLMSHRAAAVAYLSIITGSCMGLALVHAGTGNEAIRDVLVAYVSMFLRLRGGKLLRYQKQQAASKDPSITPKNYSTPFMKVCTEHKSAKALVEMLFSCMCLSLGVVMSGTGDVDALRVLREARMKSEESPYGTLMAISMATGMLFLCGGKAAFRRDPISVGLLLMSICPWFPNRTADNRAHLQATRHFYAMAVEWRWLRCVDVDSGDDVPGVEVEVSLASGAKQVLKTPCLLPELSSIMKIVSKSSDHHPAELSLSFGDNSGAKQETQSRISKERVSSSGPLVIYLKKAIRATNNLKSTGSTAGVNSTEIRPTDALSARHTSLEQSLRSRLSLKVACSRPTSTNRSERPSPVLAPTSKDNIARIQAEALRTYTRLDEALTSFQMTSAGPHNTSRHILADITSSGSVFRGIATQRIDQWSDASRLADVLPYQSDAAATDTTTAAMTEGYHLQPGMKSVTALSVKAIRSLALSERK